MELSNREWVGRGLEILARGLAPWVDRRMAAFWPGSKTWLQVMIDRARRDGRWPMLTRSDARLLLRVIEENPKAFLGSLSKLDLAYVREIREVANRWAHFEAFSDADVTRALDTIARLLRAARAAGEATEADELLTGKKRVPPDAAPGNSTDATGVITHQAPPATPGLGDQFGEAKTSAGVLEFRKRDADYLAWVKAHRDGWVLNTGPRGGGNPVLHRAACATISRTPPFTSGYYIKVYSNSLDALDRWMLSRTDSTAQRCGLCRPSALPPEPR